MNGEGWREAAVPFGEGELRVRVPPQTEVLRMAEEVPLADPERAIREALEHPIGSPPLQEVVKAKGETGKLKVAIAVSDITRPVPYRGPTGILPPLLEALERAGIRRERITLVVATGMHRPSTPEEKVRMFGEEVVQGFRIEDHDCRDRSRLRYVGETSKGTEVWVNSTFYEADLRILTGLVEAHFMAGFSGGRKSVCPGLVDERSVQRFHGPEFLEDPRADNLILEGNPCHEEALEVAQKVGVDFILNVTVDRAFGITGVYAGDMVGAHLEACRRVKEAVSIPIAEPYDLVITHGGYVGINHYQTAKAACGALQALKDGGYLVIVADNRDVDPIGSPEYRTLLHLLKLQGPEGYVEILRSPRWRFTRDQWEPEMWGKALRKVGAQGLIYCSPNIPEEDYVCIPGISGWDLIRERRPQDPKGLTEAMLQEAILMSYNRLLERGGSPRVALLEDGPYGIPVLSGVEAHEEGRWPSPSSI